VPFPSVSGRLRHGASFPTRRSSDLATVMRGPCLRYGEANGWWPCAEAVRHTCGVELDDSTTDARRKVESTVARVTGHDVHDAHVERISDGLLYLLGRFGERVDVDPVRARDEALW